VSSADAAIAFAGPYRYAARFPSDMALEDCPAIQGCRGRPSHDVPAERTKMPKLKTKSGVKKRFKLTATGKLKHGVAGKRHRLISHNGKYIRQNRGTTVLSKADTATVKAWAPYGLN
jgi:large subunit ribosomal protein L35